ncbi:MAG: galactokinase [Anaerolineae bacterium]|nr:galactokinase [Anaerolineae bacterium]
MSPRSSDLGKPPDPKDSIAAHYRERHGSTPVIIVAAPGRVNLIGEHTDYNGGFVLPAAINRHMVIAASPREDTLVCLHSVDFSSDASFSLDAISHDTQAEWSNYERAVAWALQEAGYELRGMNAVLAGNIPIGSGLSSSAAIEVATAYAFRTLNDLPLDLVTLAKLCQWAENEFVGVKCGIMDQFISALGQAQHALLIDCHSLDHRLVPLPAEMSLGICDTKVRRDLVSSAYNERRAQCETGAQLLGVPSLRDAEWSTFEDRQQELPEPVRQRCRHVISENQRVLDAVAALEEGNLPAFGMLMNQSHESLRDDYEVSCRELDIMVEATWEVDGVYGSRMTGAGFGGCTISAVRPDAVGAFQAQVSDKYKSATGLTPSIYVCQAEAGVRLL